MEKKTKEEKEDSSSPILYNVILAISEEMVGRRANLRALLFEKLLILPTRNQKATRAV